MKNDIIIRLILIRANYGLTPEDFAAEAGIDIEEYLSVEDGKRLIGHKITRKICLTFNINSGWLLTGQGEMYDKINP